MELEPEAGIRWSADGDDGCCMRRRWRLTVGSRVMAKDGEWMCLDTGGTLESPVQGLRQKNVLKECQ